jgi:hypothetical protein
MTATAAGQQIVFLTHEAESNTTQLEGHRWQDFMLENAKLFR